MLDLKCFTRYRLIIGSLGIILCLAGCSKDDYLDDGGVHNAVTPLSNYDYLAANQYQQFDTVLMIIDHFGLKDSVNAAGTFFAPTNYTIQHILTDQKIATLDSLYSVSTSKLLTQFMFADTSLTLNNVSTNIQVYNNWADTTAGVRKLIQSYGSVTSTLSYYVMQYVKINGYLDGTTGAPANDPLDVIMTCQTSGIKTSSGTKTLHVLANISPITVK